MSWLDSITNSADMNLGRLQKIAEDRTPSFKAGLLQLEVQAGHLGILSEADSDSIGLWGLPGLADAA